jgi:hypothetical protein
MSDQNIFTGPPSWCPTAVATKGGWANAVTGEVLHQTGGNFPQRNEYIAASVGPINIPYGFNGPVPFTITRAANGAISHNYDIVAAKPAYTGTIYVGPGGTDTNDGSTYALRVRSLKQGIVKANARGAATRLLVDPAIYRFSDVVSTIPASFGAQRPTVDLVIEPSSPGKIVSLCDVVMPAFVVTADPQVYVSTYTTQSVTHSVIDLSTTNAKGRPKMLRRSWPTATDAVTVAATLQARHTQYGQGAFYLDTVNKKLYVRTIDGRAPDANIAVSSGQNFNYEGNSTTLSLKTWMDSVETWCGSNPFRTTSNATTSPTVWGINCGFCYGSAGHGYTLVSGLGTSYLVNCTADDNGADGFDYNGITDGTGGNGASPIFYEFSCTADNNGWVNDGDQSSNGSTSHAGCFGVRVNCSYTGITNRPIHDIQGSQTWNLGVTIGPNATVTNPPTTNGPYASVCSGYPNLGYPSTSKIWLDSCTLSEANPYDFYAFDGGQVFYTRMRSPRTLSILSGKGSAVLPY